MRRLQFFAFFFAFVAATGTVDAQPSDRPNVILIMADDIGYESYGAFGGTSYRLPSWTT